MSRVYLIAADKPLSLCDRREERTAIVGKYTVSALCGLHVMEHHYYRHAVERLKLPMKPNQYELQLECNSRDLDALRDYLTEQCACGESVELWSLWVGDDSEPRPVRCQGNLSDFDMDALQQFFTAQQICMTITI